MTSFNREYNQIMSKYNKRPTTIGKRRHIAPAALVMGLSATLVGCGSSTETREQAASATPSHPSSNENSTPDGEAYFYNSERNARVRSVAIDVTSLLIQRTATETSDTAFIPGDEPRFATRHNGQQGTWGTIRYQVPASSPPAFAETEVYRKSDGTYDMDTGMVDVTVESPVQSGQFDDYNTDSITMELGLFGDNDLPAWDVRSMQLVNGYAPHNYYSAYEGSISVGGQNYYDMTSADESITEDLPRLLSEIGLTTE
jgi:hypothetical protein